jgi:tRNA(His) guanylyltransferase
VTKDELGDRMKRYELVTKNFLVRRMPAIIRLDGRAFHTVTRKLRCTKPFDQQFFDIIKEAVTVTMFDVQTSIFAYYQSDEISILLKDYAMFTTDAWFDGNIQKITSLAAAKFSVIFDRAMQKTYGLKDAEGFYHGIVPTFDARVFNIPKEDVVNYFVWRQKDATRNSINALGQANFSHAELQGKSQNDVLDMLHEKGINWNDCPTIQKRGGACYRKDCTFMGARTHTFSHDDDIPIFTENREFIERFL